VKSRNSSQCNETFLVMSFITASESSLWFQSGTELKTTWCKIKVYAVFHKKRIPLLFFFHNLLKWWAIWMKFLPVVAEELVLVNWCCQLLLCFDGEKSASLVTNIWSFSVAATEKVQSDRVYVSVGIVDLSHVRARQCTSTPSLQDVWVFGSRDAWVHVSMLLSADTISIFH